MTTSNRVTRADVDRLCERINQATNSPTEYGTTQRGKLTHNIGHFHCASGYGGLMFERTTSPLGGTVNIFGSGYIPTKDMYNRLQAFIKGLETGKSL